MIPASILQIRPQSTDLIHLEIQPSDPSYSWKAGQWVDFAVQIGANLHVAGYSFCSAAGAGRFSLLVRKSKHPVTQWLYTQAKVRDAVFIGPASGPCFYDPEKHEEIVCMAGGIGITPMISMLRTARRLGKKAVLYHSIRYQEDILFEREIPSTHRFIGERLQFQQLAKRHGPQAHYFFCGPRSFIDDGVIALQQLEYPNLHFERWW